MACQPSNYSYHAIGTLLFAAILVPTSTVLTTTARSEPTQVDPVVAGVLSAGIVLVIGGVYAFGPQKYTERATQKIHQRPGTMFVTGLLVWIATTVLLVVVAFIAWPLGFLLALVVGIPLGIVSILGYLAVGRLVTESWHIAVVIAAIVGGITGFVPIAGGILALILGCMGIGAAVK